MIVNTYLSRLRGSGRLAGPDSDARRVAVVQGRSVTPNASAVASSTSMHGIRPNDPAVEHGGS